MELSTAGIKKSFVNILHRYHVMIFVIFVLGGLVVMVFMLNNIIVRFCSIDCIKRSKLTYSIGFLTVTWAVW